jgi:cyclopropane-fatty-acyl-phospholipid synthase
MRQDYSSEENAAIAGDLAVATTQKTDVRPEHQLYHEYSTDVDQTRTNVHYEQPPEFFLLITGGDWNVYSANLWDPGTETDTQSQAAKLDLIARLAGLQKGMRLIDVGCGWAGPLTYLCETYGLTGTGLTLSPTQKKYAEGRIARHGVDAKIVLSHWEDYTPEEQVDAIYTDEVIVHFFNLGGFFQKSHDWLKPGGVMINKELHLKHPRHAKLERGGEFVSQIYGDTGNYRTLAEETKLANDAGFDIERVHHIERRHYEVTIDHWLANMHKHADQLKEMVGEQHYRDFRVYLRLARHIQRNVTLDVVVCRRFD